MATPRRTLITLALVVVAAGGGAEGLRTWVQQQRGQALRAVARPGDIRMISQLSCTYCNQARTWMERHQVPFEECFIERDARCAADYERAGRRGTPTLLVRGQVQLGFDAQRLTRLLGGTGS